MSSCARSSGGGWAELLRELRLACLGTEVLGREESEKRGMDFVVRIARARILPLGPVPIGASLTGERSGSSSTCRPFLLPSGSRNL